MTSCISDRISGRLCLLALAALIASPVTAQEVVDSALSDLNGDGLRERFTLLDDGDGAADLIIEDTGTGRITVPDIVWIGGIGQEPTLDVANNGSIRLTGMNESIGRNRWRQTLTIAHRGGDYMVAGYTYEFYDTLDLDAAGECDLNLLNGKGFIRRGHGALRPTQHAISAVPLVNWREDVPIPALCRLWE